ncbi:type II 3-dehydroquinate dehydratase [Deferribacterales bacterium Es71-Z0220]|jgi:3-dehydroquinate dehydratase-2|uniref:type II 3-dehydroquinate dehydratase n=1 Tax=Deferrivibrio essentukiensis TaxID=2880922 RepID=UPI001F618C6F|nr:type II 3-dehydroquinate dehydratase [Deferrivibrio essentukiensis]MCB4203448.1 type II 3-dehydroquinate dehydratase [Deferrivibrio essentukiensis]
MKRVLVINGPNLNMLGQREPSVYGNTTYEELVSIIKNHCESKNIYVEVFQSNHEGDIIERIHKSKDFDALVINAGAYTHTSIAIRDALAAVNIPFIEVHISNIYKRETFRHKSMLSDLAVGLITGLGIRGYLYAIDYFADIN